MKYILHFVIICGMFFSNLPTAWMALEPCSPTEPITKNSTNEQRATSNTMSVFQDIQPTNVPTLQNLGLNCQKVVPAGGNSTDSKKTVEIAKTTTEIIRNILSLVTGFIASFAALYAIFQLIIHALGVVQSQGDSGKLEAAKKGILNTVVSLLIISMAYMIVYTVINTVLAVPAAVKSQNQQNR